MLTHEQTPRALDYSRGHHSKQDPKMQCEFKAQAVSKNCLAPKGLLVIIHGN